LNARTVCGRQRPPQATAVSISDVHADINRTASRLAQKRKRILTQAKTELRRLFGRPE
jgi:hypothetical protein